MDSGAATGPGPARKRSESRQRTELVALRLLPHERDELAEAARARGMTMSELIRSSAMEVAHSSETAASDHAPAPSLRRVR